MDEPFFKPEQFARRSGIARTDTDLRRWLRSIGVSARVEFIKGLFPLNYRYAISLVRSSQIPIDDVVQLLQYWLSQGKHNASKGLVEGLLPVLGEKRFWTTAAQMDLTPAMSDFLNYHGRRQLDRYRNS